MAGHRRMPPKYATVYGPCGDEINFLAVLYVLLNDGHYTLL